MASWVFRLMCILAFPSEAHLYWVSMSPNFLWSISWVIPASWRRSQSSLSTLSASHLQESLLHNHRRQWSWLCCWRFSEFFFQDWELCHSMDCPFCLWLKMTDPGLNCSNNLWKRGLSLSFRTCQLGKNGFTLFCIPTVRL